MEKSFVYINNASTPEYREKLELIDRLKIDPFARKYLKGQRFGKKDILLETGQWTVFSNEHKYPNTKHQFVFVSYEYAENLWDLSDEAYLELKKLLRQFCEEYGISGGGIVSRFGNPEKSGTTVTHLHLQLIEPEDGKSVAAWFGEKK